MTFISVQFVCWKREQSLFVVNLKINDIVLQRVSILNFVIENNFRAVNKNVVVDTCMLFGNASFVFSSSTVDKIENIFLLFGRKCLIFEKLAIQK